MPVYIYHKPSMASPVLRTGHNTRSGHYWVGVQAERNAPFTKWGPNHKDVQKARTSALKVASERQWPVAVFERGSGRCLWDSKHGVYDLELFLSSSQS